MKGPELGPHSIDPLPTRNNHASSLLVELSKTLDLIPFTPERFIAQRPLYEKVETVAQTPFGMRGSVDTGSRFFGLFSRDTDYAALHRRIVHAFVPNRRLYSGAKTSVRGLLEYHDLSDMGVAHEIRRLNREDSMFQSGFFQLNGKPEFMYNYQGAEEEGLTLFTLAKFLSQRQGLDSYPIVEPVLNWGRDRQDEGGGFIRYKYDRNDSGEIVGMTSRGLMDSTPVLQHVEPELNTVVHPTGILIPPDGEKGIALSEAQIYWWGALKAWADILSRSSQSKHLQKAAELEERADRLKDNIQKYLIQWDNQGRPRIALGIDGLDNPIRVPTALSTAIALSVSFQGEHVIELPDALSLARDLTSEDVFFNPGFGVQTIAKDTILPNGDNYQVGIDGTRIHWSVINAQAAIGTRNLAGSLAMKGRSPELIGENLMRSALLARTGLITTTVQNDEGEEMGLREQNIVDDDHVSFYVDTSDPDNPIPHPKLMTISATALNVMSYLAEVA